MGYLGGGGFDPSAYMLQQLMKELFEDKTSEHKSEAANLLNLTSMANSQEGFDNLQPILEDWSKRNDTMGEDIQAFEAVLMPAFQSRKEQFGKLKLATINSNKLLDPTYYVSEADKARALAGEEGALGGIQNISKEDISGWTYEKMAKESDAINAILDGFNAGKGMTFNIKDGKYNVEQLKRHMADYKSTLDAGVEMAFYSGTIPDDPRIIRAIMEGNSDAVAKIREEEALNQKSLYTQYNRKIGTLHTAKLEVDARIGAEENPIKQNQMLFSLLSGNSDDKTFNKWMQENPDTIAEMVKGMNLANTNYESWSESVKTQIGGKDGTGGLVGARQMANERYKKYKGVYIEDIEASWEKELPLLFGKDIITPPSGGKKKTVDVTKIDLDVKENAWGNEPLSSYREDYERGGMSDDPNSPIYAIDGVYQYPELFDKKKKKIVPTPPPIESPSIESYKDFIGIPSVDMYANKANTLVDNMDIFKKLEESIVELKLGKDGRGRGYKLLNQIKKAYNKKLKWHLRHFGASGRDTEEYWNKMSNRALEKFLKSKSGVSLIDRLNKMIQVETKKYLASK